MAKKEKTAKATTEKGMVLLLDSPERSKLKEIQAKYIESGCDKTLAQIALDCLKIGIHSKILNLNEI